MDASALSEAPGERSAARLAALEAVALEDARRRTERALEVAREQLAMDVSYYSEFTQTHQVIARVSGDAESFGFEPGEAIPLEETYCRRMVSGQIPNVIENAREHGGVRELPPTFEAGIGAYVGVPLQLADGRVYGTLCCASHEPHAELGEQDVRFLRVLGRLIADELDRTLASGAERVLAPVEASPGGDDGALVRLSLWFAGAPRAAPSARRALESLSEHVEPARLYDLSLLVTELITNSVRHAGIGPASAVGLEVVVLADRVRAAVTDPGPGFEPNVPDPDELDEGGRGLFIVEQLASRWGVETDPETRVWLELDVA